MKRLIGVVVFLAALTLAGSAFAENLQTDLPEKVPLSSKVPISLYGFISAESMYSNSQLSSFGTNNNTPASYVKGMAGYNRVIDESIGPDNDAAIGFTPQNTRFGFNLEPYDFGGKNFKADGRIELDFYNNTDTTISGIKPRLRRAYAAIGQERWRALFGQEWDVFSPLNTSTLNIGANLWRQGNMGYRRPQIAFFYNQPVVEEISFEIAGSANVPGSSLNFDDNGNTTGLPMFEGRIGFLNQMDSGLLKVYVSAAYARHNNQVLGNAKVDNWAVSGSVDAPLHKYFNLSGEIHYGYSMEALYSNTQDTLDQRFVAGWGQIKSNWFTWLETNAGFGFEVLRANEVPMGWVSRNYLAFANAMFKPVDPFVIGLEYNYLMTKYQGTTPLNNASAVLLNVLFFF